jgi:hypothetical protein
LQTIWHLTWTPRDLAPFRPFFAPLTLRPGSVLPPLARHPPSDTRKARHALAFHHPIRASFGHHAQSQETATGSSNHQGSQGPKPTCPSRWSQSATSCPCRSIRQQRRYLGRHDSFRSLTCISLRLRFDKLANYAIPRTLLPRAIETSTVGLPKTKVPRGQA